jgi:two-component sensor histidine kinase
MANSLQLAADFLLFEYARLQDATAKEALTTAAARLNAVAQLHRFLCGHDATDVDLALFLDELGDLLARSTGLTCTIDAETCRLSGDVAQQLGIVINELAMNAAKHAYGDPGGQLHVEARIRAGHLRLTVWDDGRGLSDVDASRSASGLGMTIVAAVVRQLNATLRTASDHGARFTIHMPLPSAAPRISRSFAPRA